MKPPVPLREATVRDAPAADFAAEAKLMAMVTIVLGAIVPESQAARLARLLSAREPPWPTKVRRPEQVAL